MLFARKVILKRDLGFIRAADQRGGGGVRRLQRGGVFHQTILVLRSSDSLAELTEILMVFRVVSLDDTLAGNGFQSALVMVGNLDVGECRACEDFRRPCVSTSHYQNQRSQCDSRADDHCRSWYVSIGPIDFLGLACDVRETTGMLSRALHPSRRESERFV